MVTEVSSISAINRVLLAESENRDSIGLCRQQAEKIIQNGRSKARRINNRIDRQISTVHKRADAAIQNRITELKLKMESLSREPVLDEKEYEELYSAISTLADEMVGSDQ